MEAFEKVCEERHVHVQERLDRNEDRLNNHSKRLDSVEQNFSRMDAQMGGLISEIGKLNSILRWLFGLGLTALIGFFIRAVERAVM